MQMFLLHIWLTVVKAGFLRPRVFIHTFFQKAKQFWHPSQFKWHEEWVFILLRLCGKIFWRWEVWWETWMAEWVNDLEEKHSSLRKQQVQKPGSQNTLSGFGEQRQVKWFWNWVRGAGTWNGKKTQQFFKNLIVLVKSSVFILIPFVHRNPLNNFEEEARSDLWIF